VDLDPVGMLSEGDRWQTDLDRALAAALHRTARRIPRPFGVHVEVGWQEHQVRLQRDEPGQPKPPTALGPTGASRHLPINGEDPAE
jgi:hypothetical protein